ncbi:response regulator [Tolypothrix sp. FACHB-123]|uniref:response regulator n=1 Tax=Tolypothrix sp. FACHB-123 TaxID=2692868 RepID=UPI001689F557|nr:response regulator [Tolypothrix sp. FACHB-123]MBD2355800.1 response regulator [Tolypothrix sp. FACHB-123]
MLSEKILNAKIPEDSLVLAGLRVLLVEDNEDTQLLLTFLLEDAGADVVVTGSAYEALAVLERMQPDILLCDIGLPEIDGCTLMRKIRAMSTNQLNPIPAIALTAYAQETVEQEALASGFHAYFVKPIEPMEFVNSVAKVLKNNYITNPTCKLRTAI